MPEVTAQIWDAAPPGGNLIYTFSDGEAVNTLPIDHPVAVRITEESPTALTIDIDDWHWIATPVSWTVEQIDGDDWLQVVWDIHQIDS